MGSYPMFHNPAISPKTVRVSKMGPSPFFGLTHNYTGDWGPRDSPHLCKTLDFRGLAEAHRYLSERGIIAFRRPRSTNSFTYLGLHPRDARYSLTGANQGGPGLPENACFYSQIARLGMNSILAGRASGHMDLGKPALSYLVYVGGSNIDVQALVLDPLAVDPHRTLLDHAECLRGAGHQAGFL